MVDHEQQVVDVDNRNLRDVGVARRAGTPVIDHLMKVIHRHGVVATLATTIQLPAARICGGQRPALRLPIAMVFSIGEKYANPGER